METSRSSVSTAFSSKPSNVAAFTCEKCSSVFTRKDNLNRHLKTKCSNLKLHCPKCGRTMSRSDILQKHILICKIIPCPTCKATFYSKISLKQHQKECKPDLRSKRSKLFRNELSNEEGITTIQSAFNKNLVTYYIKNIYGSNDLESFFTLAFNILKIKIEDCINIWPGVSVNFCLDVIYAHPITGTKADRNFKTKSVVLFANDDVAQIINDGVDKISSEIDDYEGHGSGYVLSIIEGIVLNISKHNPLRAACNIPIPTWIVKTESCDHTQYLDTDDCFRHSILALNPSGKVFDFSCMTIPVLVKDIVKFEALNNVRVYIFALDEDEKIYPFRVSKSEGEYCIDLLLLASEQHNHFVRIFKLDRLIKKQLTKHHGAIALCRRCLSFFQDRPNITKEEKLYRHQLDCISQPTRVIMPTEDNNKLQILYGRHQVRIPFVVYCDIESLLVPIATCEPPVVDETTEQYRPYTNKYQEHQIMSYGMYVKSDVHNVGEDPDFNRAIIYTGPDAALKLLKTLTRIGEKVIYYYSLNKPVYLSDEELESHRAATLCYFCKLEFSINNVKVIDHNHITGKYRGASHQSCNIAARKPDFLPIFFHNGSGYDFKFLVRELGKTPGEIQVIPNNEEKFMSFSKKIRCNGRYLWLRFLDSCRFLPSSLDKIVKTLAPEQFSILPKHYEGKKLDLLLRKGQMPYDYMTDWAKLDETSLPSREQFYSLLNEDGISDEEYKHAQDVWSEFNIKNLRDYSELYLKTDVYLLAEMYENFRLEFLNSDYNLEVVNFYSLPGLAFEGMLKITGEQLELICDYSMMLLLERGLRGGFTQVSLRHAKSDESNELCYIDANNLYGFASCQPLPQSNFHWVEPHTVNLLTVSDNSDIGYIAEVDIVIPENLHDYFNDLPPLPQHFNPPGSNYVKLVGTLAPKERYVLHYRVLQFVVAHGCELKNIHRVIGFRQTAWLAPFININNEKRKTAKSDFEKDLMKLLNNATFGKCIEQVRKRIDLRIVNKWASAEKLIARPNFQSRTIIAENLVIIHMKKTNITFNKPIYAGFAILEMAKLKMLTFHYETMLRHYGPERLKLAYTDTDSFVYLIKSFGQDWRLEAMQVLGSHFDFSNLPLNHPCYSAVNQKVLGKFKDELEGRKFLEWIGLRAKMYAISQETESPIKKIKGIKKSAVNKKLTFDDFRNVLFGNNEITTKFNLIRSFRQRLYTVAVNKLALTSKDDKRHVLPDKVNTLAHGHYRILEEDNDEEEDEEAMT